MRMTFTSSLKTGTPSIWKPPYPDLLPPVVDLNGFLIEASPTSPDAPNGETLVEFTLSVQDNQRF